METMQLVMKLMILVFVVSSMAALGLSLNFKEIIKPLRQPMLLIVTMLVNFVVSPALAYLLCRLLPLNTSYETGLLLLSAAAGAPFLPKLVELAGGDVTLSVSMLLLQVSGSILLMPVTLPLLIPGLQADVISIALPLLLQMLLPLVLGLIFQQMAPRVAIRLQTLLKLLTSVSALGAVVLLLISNMQGMFATLGSGAGLLALAYVVLTMSAGYLGGVVVRSSGIVHALASGQRNIAAALVTAAGNQLDELVMVMLIMTTFVGLIPLIGAAVYWKRRTNADSQSKGTNP